MEKNVEEIIYRHLKWIGNTNGYPIIRMTGNDLKICFEFGYDTEWEIENCVSWIPLSVQEYIHYMFMNAKVEKFMIAKKEVSNGTN